MPKCYKCGTEFTCLLTPKGGKPRVNCYTCSPVKKKLPTVVSAKGHDLRSLSESKPEHFAEVPGATYTVVVTPWSKLRPQETHHFTSRNDAEKCAFQYRRFGERAVVYVNYPPKGFQGGNSHTGGNSS